MSDNSHNTSVVEKNNASIDNKIIRAKRYSIFFVLIFIFILCIIAYSFLDFSAFQKLSALPTGLIIFLSLLSIVNYISRAWRWHIFSLQLKLPVPLITNFLYFFAGFSMASTPGKVGEAIRLWFLKSNHQINYKDSAPLILADRILDLWAVLILILITVYSFSSYGSNVFIIFCVLTFLSIPCLFPKTALRVILVLPKTSRLINFIVAFFEEVFIALQKLTALKAVGASLLLSLIGWIAEGYGFYLLMLELGANITLQQAIFIFTFSMIVGAISMMPGGLGSTEATAVFLLMAIGIDFEIALLGTVIIRIITLWFAILLGFLILPFTIWYSQKYRVEKVAA